MLDREAEAYQRDMRRARRSTVYLPESEAPSPDFFKNPRQFGLSGSAQGTSDVDAEHLLLADTFRIPTDGIYLRDPECLLFKEWARLDLENSSLGAGFEFTAIAYSNGRPEAASIRRTTTSRSIPSAQTAAICTPCGRDCRPKKSRPARSPAGNRCRSGPSRRLCTGTATLGSLLADPWVGGQSQFGNAVSTPHRGTLIGPAGNAQRPA